MLKNKCYLILFHSIQVDEGQRTPWGQISLPLPPTPNDFPPPKTGRQHKCIFN